MARIRQELPREAAQLAESAHNLADWRYYVRQHPWICLGGIAALGFLAVAPRASRPAGIEVLVGLADQAKPSAENVAINADRGKASLIRHGVGSVIHRLRSAFFRCPTRA